MYLVLKKIQDEIFKQSNTLIINTYNTGLTLSELIDNKIHTISI